jgi:hypothetical protein
VCVCVRARVLHLAPYRMQFRARVSTLKNRVTFTTGGEPGYLSRTALGYGLDDRGFEYRQGLGIFLFTTVSRPALGPTQPPIQRVPGALSIGVKRPGHEGDHSPPFSAEVKECVELYLHPNMPSWRGAQLKDKTLRFLTTWVITGFWRRTLFHEVTEFHHPACKDQMYWMIRKSETRKRIERTRTQYLETKYKLQILLNQETKVR